MVLANEKTISLIVPGSNPGEDQVFERVAVRPNDTAKDVLARVGMAGSVLGTLDGKIFRDNEALYDRIENGDTLAVTPHMEAGEDFLDGFIRDLKEWYKNALRDQAVRQTQTVSPMTQVSQSSSTLSNLMQKKMWRESSPGIFDGYLITRWGPRKARVWFGRTGFQSIMIHNPPKELWESKHPHRVCFNKRKETGWYDLHMQDIPTTVNDAIINTERIFDEAYKLLTSGKAERALRQSLEQASRR